MTFLHEEKKSWQPRRHLHDPPHAGAPPEDNPRGRGRGRVGAGVAGGRQVDGGVAQAVQAAVAAAAAARRAAPEQADDPQAAEADEEDAGHDVEHEDVPLGGAGDGLAEEEVCGVRRLLLLLRVRQGQRRQQQRGGRLRRGVKVHFFLFLFQSIPGERNEGLTLLE